MRGSFHRNGSEAFKFVTGQPQKKVSIQTGIASACPEAVLNVKGAFYALRRVFVTSFGKETLMVPGTKRMMVSRP